MTTRSTGAGTMSEQYTGAAPVAPDDAERRRRTRALRRRTVSQLVFELALPLGAYYGMRGFGANQWLSMVVGGLLVLPWVVYGVVRHRRVETMALFTLSLVVVGTVISLFTGDPRMVMLRDSWLMAAIGVWVLVTLATRRPFVMAASRGVIIAKVGEQGLAEYEGRWDTEALFRHHMRLLTTVWGCGFLLDAAARAVLAFTIPVDAFPLANTGMWLAILFSMLGFHNWYITRHGLKL